MEVVYESEPSSEEVVLDRLPLMDVIENGALLEALQKLNERERQIFLARTLEEEDFETLGEGLGCPTKGWLHFITGRFRKSERALKEVTRNEF